MKIEAVFYAQLIRDFENDLHDPGDVRHCLAALLYRRPFQLPAVFDLEIFPADLVEPYVGYMLAPPEIFRETGDADAYHRHTEAWVAYLHEGVVNNPKSLTWQRVAQTFATYSNFIPLYFNTASLKETYRQRAEITETYLRNKGFSIDVENWPNTAKDRKIRAGIVAATLNSLTDTYTMMPAVQHLDRERFEITLFALKLGTGKSGKARHFQDGIDHVGERLDTVFALDQLSLNHALYTEGLHGELLPSLCNWVCHRALPVWRDEDDVLCEPFLPHSPIHIIHLNADTKHKHVELKSIAGQTRTTSLKFSALFGDN